MMGGGAVMMGSAAKDYEKAERRKAVCLAKPFYRYSFIFSCRLTFLRELLLGTRMAKLILKILGLI